MAAEDKPKGDRIEMDASEFNNMVREGLENVDVDAEVGRKRLEDKKLEEKKEPEVKVEEKPPVRGEVKREPEVKEEEDETVKLRRENEELRRRMEVRDREPDRRETARREPDIEMTEVVPGSGIKLPKDKKYWAVRLDEGMVDAVGLDKTATKGLEILANVFYNYIAETVPQAAFKMYQDFDATRSVASQRETAFFEMFPDLKDHKDLSEFVESKERPAIMAAGYRGQDYFREVGKRTRTRIAAMRGITPEEYERSLVKTDSTTGRTGSRAVTTSAGSRGTRGRPSDENKELNDMIG